jgi:hypothetical protein
MFLLNFFIFVQQSLHEATYFYMIFPLYIFLNLLLSLSFVVQSLM